jgi:sialidase-1
MPDGTLFAFAEGRVNNNSDSGNIDIVMRQSFDNGATWSGMQVAFNFGGNTAGNPTPIVDRQTGILHLMFSRNNTEAFVAKYNSAAGQFNAPMNITDVARDLNVPFFVNRLGPGPTAGIQTDSGRLIAPIWVNRTIGVDATYRSGVLYSDDGGTTWHAGGVVPVTSTIAGSNEAAVAMYADGSLYMTLRTNQGTPGRASSVSLDGGLTWSTAQLAPEIDADMTDVKASLISLGTPEDHLLLSAPRGPDRNNMTVWLNSEKADEWSVFAELGAGPAGYSELTTLSSDLVGLLYENGNSDYRERITWSRLDAAALLVPEPQAWFAALLGGVCLGLTRLRKRLLGGVQ